MNKLMVELRRLYFLPHPPGPPPEALAGSLELIGQDGGVRTLVAGFPGVAGWEAAARLLQGVGEELELPAPAVSIAGKDGFRVWFSLSEPVPAEEARAFLDGLRKRYLAGTPPACLSFHPAIDGAPGEDRVRLAPATLGEGGKWSAYIDPAMGGMFGEEPWLEMEPNPDKQAGLLAEFRSIGAGDFRRVLDLLRAEPLPDGGAAGEPEAMSDGESRAPGRPFGIDGHFSDPRSFLLAVMNDPAVSLDRRIEAARALLPCCMKAPCG